MNNQIAKRTIKSHIIDVQNCCLDFIPSCNFCVEEKTLCI